MKFIPNKLSRTVARKVLVAKKNSPHIFFVGGVIGVVGGTVMACRATLHLEDALDEIASDLAEVHGLAEDRQDDPEYTRSDYIRDLGYVYGKGASKLTRLYGPPVFIGVVSIGSLTGSHITLTRRNAALTATLTSVISAFNNYRERMQVELGEDRERDIYRNVQKEEILTPEGKEVMCTVGDPNKYSIYARFFDELSDRWEKDPELNRLKVHVAQNYANSRLQVVGHLFLNEVYDMLGLQRSQAGQVVGWVLNGDGDGYVDFGIYNSDNSMFVNNMERSILLDFNVDGVIMNKI